MPEAIQIQGYISYITQASSAFFGTYIGAFAASFFAFSPAIMKIPKHLLGLKNRFILSSDPVNSNGKVINIQASKNHTDLTILYNSHEKTFNVDNRAIITPLSKGDEVTVFYDPNNPDIAYLDFHYANEELKSSFKESETLFKLLDITPRFDINRDSFELSGEIHGGEYQGRKASIIHDFPRAEAHKLIPGTLFQCIITGNENNYNIQLITST